MRNSTIGTKRANEVLESAAIESHKQIFQGRSCFFFVFCAAIYALFAAICHPIDIIFVAYVTYISSMWTTSNIFYQSIQNNAWGTERPEHSASLRGPTNENSESKTQPSITISGNKRRGANSIHANPLNKQLQQWKRQKRWTVLAITMEICPTNTHQKWTMRHNWKEGVFETLYSKTLVSPLKFWWIIWHSVAVAERISVSFRLLRSQQNTLRPIEYFLVFDLNHKVF